jgi:hypothetical protein
LSGVFTQCVEVNLPERRVEVDLHEQGIEVDLLERRVHVHPLQQRVEVNHLEQRIDVHCLDDDVDEPLCDALSQQFRRSFASRARPVAWFHQISIAATPVSPPAR